MPSPRSTRWQLEVESVDNAGQPFPTLHLSIDGSIKGYSAFCFIYCVNVFWFNIQLAKELKMAVFSFYAKLCFSFLPFLNLGAQISCPENPYTDLKSPLDQPLFKKHLKWQFLKVCTSALKFSSSLLYCPKSVKTLNFLKMFTLRDLSFSCFRWMFIEVPKFQENSPALKNSWLSPCQLPLKDPEF